MSHIISCLAIISPFFNQMWIILENNLSYILIFNHMNRHLGLSCALRAKSFFDRHFFQWWLETFHMPSFSIPITNQHNNNSCRLPTHINKLLHGQLLRMLNLVVYIRNMTWYTITCDPSMFDHLRPPTTTHQKGSTFHACKIPHLVMTSNVISVVCCI